MSYTETLIICMDDVLLPSGILDWVNLKDFNLDNFLEADLDYSDGLHDLHNDHPLVGN